MVWLQVRKAKKLLPYDQKLMDTWPGRSKKQDAARNTPREGGFGAGGAYQKINKNIPSARSGLLCSRRASAPLLITCIRAGCGRQQLTHKNVIVVQVLQAPSLWPTSTPWCTLEVRP